MISAQKEFFTDKPIRLSNAEVIKYLARLRDEVRKFNQENGINRPNWFHEWLSTRIFDPEERLIYAGCFFSMHAFTRMMLEGVKIVHLEITAGPQFGDVHWELAHECVVGPCPHQSVER